MRNVFVACTAAALLGSGLTGCATDGIGNNAAVAFGAITGISTSRATGAMYNETRLAELTAPVLRVRSDQIQVVDLQSTPQGSYYNVVFLDGRAGTHCYHDGKASGLGASNPPTCGD